MRFINNLILFIPFWTISEICAQYNITTNPFLSSLPFNSFPSFDLWTSPFISPLPKSDNTNGTLPLSNWFKQPLWGVTYVPFRRTTVCAGVLEEDVVDDLKIISKIAFQVYVPQMYCNLSALIANTTHELGTRLVLGLSMKTKWEFEKQFGQLERVFKEVSNLSHLSAISVGYGDLQNYLNTNQTNFVIQSLTRVKTLIKNWNYTKINVTTTDVVHLLFDQPWTPLLDAYIVLNTATDDRTPNMVMKSAWDTFLYAKGTSQGIDKILKRIYITGLGWPSVSPGQASSSQSSSASNELIERKNKTFSGRIGKQSDQADFIARLICSAHSEGGMRYFYNYAFDPNWLYPNSDDERANWGLIRADHVTLKKGLKRALKPNCDQNQNVPTAQHKSDSDSTSIDSEGELQKKRNLGKIIGITIMAAVFVIMIVLMAVFWRRKKQADKLRHVMAMRTLNSNESGLQTGDPNLYCGLASSTPLYGSTTYSSASGSGENSGHIIDAIYTDIKNAIEPKHIIKSEYIKFKENIGEGHFGIVQKGTLRRNGEEMEVAVKRLHSGATNMRQFLLEAIRMEKLQHDNVLHLIGVCLVENVPMIVVPFMERDNLLSFVRDAKNDLNVRRVLDFSVQIADGMKYLHGLKLVHRDLAARNCMLDASLKVKIADFGLCRDISDSDSYHATRTFELPVRWMAPETITKLEWTSKSDVWSYGVVLWELLTRGRQPYQDIPLVELRLFLENGGRLPKSKYCPEILYDFMKTCWHSDPAERPDFSTLRQTLLDIVKAVEDGRVTDMIGYYNAITIIHNDAMSGSS